MLRIQNRRNGIAALLIGLVSIACFSRGQELAERGDELLYQRRFDEAARQFELVLHECGDKTDEDSISLRINTLKKLADLKQFYLDDPEAALRIYRLIVELSPGGDAGFEASRYVVKLMREGASEPTAIIAEIERLMTRYPSKANIHRLNLTLGQIAFRARRYKDVERHARIASETKDFNLRVEAGLMSASAQEMQNKISEALASYETLQKESSLEADIRSQIEMSVAHCYERLGQLQRARSLFHKLAEASENASFLRDRVARLDKKIEAKRPRLGKKRRRRLRTHSSTTSP